MLDVGVRAPEDEPAALQAHRRAALLPHHPADGEGRGQEGHARGVRPRRDDARVPRRHHLLLHQPHRRHPAVRLLRHAARQREGAAVLARSGRSPRSSTSCATTRCSRASAARASTRPSAAAAVRGRSSVTGDYLAEEPYCVYEPPAGRASARADASSRRVTEATELTGLDSRERARSASQAAFPVVVAAVRDARQRRRRAPRPTCSRAFAALRTARRHPAHRRDLRLAAGSATARRSCAIAVPEDRVDEVAALIWRVPERHPQLRARGPLQRVVHAHRARRRRASQAILAEIAERTRHRRHPRPAGDAAVQDQVDFDFTGERESRPRHRRSRSLPRLKPSC